MLKLMVRKYLQFYADCFFVYLNLCYKSNVSSVGLQDVSIFKSISLVKCYVGVIRVLLDFSLTVKAVTLIFISWCVSAISSAKEGKSGFIYNLVKNK